MSYYASSPLQNEIDNADLLDRDNGDYGYGGEWVTIPAVDLDKTESFILDRERRLLGGMTLEEYLQEKSDE